MIHTWQIIMYERETMNELDSHKCVEKIFWKRFFRDIFIGKDSENRPEPLPTSLDRISKCFFESTFDSFAPTISCREKLLDSIIYSFLILWKPILERHRDKNMRYEIWYLHLNIFHLSSRGTRDLLGLFSEVSLHSRVIRESFLKFSFVKFWPEFLSEIVLRVG